MQLRWIGLREELTALKAEISQLQKEIRRLRVDVSLLKINLASKQDTYRQIQLDLASRHFQRLDTDIGSFLISVGEVTPYLDGYKLVLNVGNPLFATYASFKIKVRWGKNYDWEKYTEASHQEWEQSVQEKEIPFAQSLAPGSWNRVELFLTPAKADELGFVELSLDPGPVSLHRP